MTSARLRKIARVAIPVFAIGGFVLDLFTPLGISDWVWYFIPLLLSVYVGRRLLPFLLAAVFSLLILAGFFLSPPGIDPRLAMVSRLMGIGVLWVMAFVIWQRKRADEEVRKLSLAVEHSPVSIIITDQAGNIEYVNPKFMEVTGYSAGEVIGKNPRILKSGEMPSGDYKRLWETIVAAGSGAENFTTGGRTANFIGSGLPFPQSTAPMAKSLIFWPSRKILPSASGWSIPWLRRSISTRKSSRTLRWDSRLQGVRSMCIGQRGRRPDAQCHRAPAFGPEFSAARIVAQFGHAQDGGKNPGRRKPAAV
jgi:PAS domain-containing protein